MLNRAYDVNKPDFLRRRIFFQREKERKTYQFLTRNFRVSYNSKSIAQLLLFKKLKKKTTQTRDFCKFSNRKKAIFSTYRTSRHKFKQLVNFGHLSGVRKR